MHKGASMLVPTLLEHGTEEQELRWIAPTMRGRSDVVPGVLRAGLRERSCQSSDASQPRRRRLHR